HRPPRHLAGQGRGAGLVGSAADAQDRRQPGRPADRSVRRPAQGFDREPLAAVPRHRLRSVLRLQPSGRQAEPGPDPVVLGAGHAGRPQEHLRLDRRVLGHRLPRGPEEVRRADPGDPWRRRPGGADRPFRPRFGGAGEGRGADRVSGRPARHHRHPQGPAQPGPAGPPAPLRRAPRPRRAALPPVVLPVASRRSGRGCYGVHMPPSGGARNRPMRTITFPVFLGLALLVAAMPAAAAAEPGAGEGESAEALDLALPQSALAGYRNDPPGTWYGDTSGVPSQPERPLVVRRPACPTSPDGEETDITGSVEAGVGYSKRGGNSNWQA